jgi:hypothetical protein
LHSCRFLHDAIHEKTFLIFLVPPNWLKFLLKLKFSYSLSKKIKKIPNTLSGQNNYVFQLLFFWIGYAYDAKSGFFEVLFDYFWFIWDILNVDNLSNFLYAWLPNLFEVLIAASIYLITINVTPQKRNGRKICVDVFSQEIKEQQTRIH